VIQERVVRRGLSSPDLPPLLNSSHSEQVISPLPCREDERWRETGRGER
jgi:hypothetical protein